MIFFGHLGCGTRLVQSVAGDRLGRVGLLAILAGCIAPDVLDKSLLYTLGGPDSWVSCGRTIGHSLLFLAVLAAFSALRRSRTAWWFTLAAVSHVAIDHLADLVAILVGASEATLASFAWNSERFVGLFWPLFGNSFPTMPPVSPADHVLRALTPLNLLWEAIGLALLVPVLWRAFVVRPDTSLVHQPATQDGTASVARPSIGD